MMYNASIRIEQTFYEEIQQYAKANGLTASDIFRQGAEIVIGKIERPQNNTEQTKNAVELSQNVIEQVLRDRIASLEAQLSVKDDQLDKEQQLNALAQKNLGTLTEQLDASRRMIADLRRPWWQRVFRRHHS